VLWRIGFDSIIRFEVGCRRQKNTKCAKEKNGWLDASCFDGQTEGFARAVSIKISGRPMRTLRGRQRTKKKGAASILSVINPAIPHKATVP